MRLIDADKLLELIKDQKEREIGAYAKGINAGLNIVKSIINDETQTPTAYDVDKVVEQLKNKAIPVEDEDEHVMSESNIHETYEIKMVALSDAIEIVKVGEIDGN